MSADPIKTLQTAARSVAEHVVPGHPARRVIVLGDNNARLIDTQIPCCPSATASGETAPAVPAVVAGWSVSERGAAFDGAPVPVAPSRLKLLRTLVEAEGPLTAKELTALAFDRHTDDANTRYHIRELKKELKAAFTFDGDVISGENDGYRLVLR